MGCNGMGAAGTQAIADALLDRERKIELEYKERLAEAEFQEERDALL